MSNPLEYNSKEFSGYGGTGKDQFGKMTYPHQERIRRLMQIYTQERATLQSPVTLLDIGCADGTLSAMYMSDTTTVFGIDINEENVALCKQKGIEARYGEVENLPFGDDAFDMVIPLIN